MRHFFLRIEETRDGILHVIQTRDKKGRFLGVVSEPTRIEALAEAKALALETLLEFAEGPVPPQDSLFLTPPKTGALELSLQDLFPILLRHKRSQRGLTQTALAEQLDIKQQVYARLERPGKSNPTLSTVQRLSTILKEDILALA
jgi:DNA-binding XRE family transcriptional regulator